MRLRFQDSAIADLAALRAYIARENPAAASRVAARIRSRLNAVLANPSIAPEAPDMPGIRRLVVTGTPFLVFYRVDEARGWVEVLSVVHGARQWPASD